MSNTTSIYCRHCKRSVVATKTTAAYCCPHCGTRFTPSQFAPADKPVRPQQPPPKSGR